MQKEPGYEANSREGQETRLRIGTCMQLTSMSASNIKTTARKVVQNS